MLTSEGYLFVGSTSNFGKVTSKVSAVLPHVSAKIFVSLRSRPNWTFAYVWIFSGCCHPLILEHLSAICEG